MTDANDDSNNTQIIIIHTILNKRAVNSTTTSNFKNFNNNIITNDNITNTFPGRNIDIHVILSQKIKNSAAVLLFYFYYYCRFRWCF